MLYTVTRSKSSADLFWDIRCTAAALAAAGALRGGTDLFMREALWLCDRLCHVQPWRDAKLKLVCAEHSTSIQGTERVGKQRNIWI